ncbi:MAG TPA: tetratricopeptide repeat protein [Polyangia bacterium]|jgi:hypothetical protein
MKKAPIFRAVLLAVLASLLTIAVPGTAAAQDQGAVNKVTNLNKKAIDAYNKQDYETARELLKQALELCASAGLDKHPIRARTHIHFGIVAIVGFKQREVGLKQFRKALEVQPDIKLTKSLATPELQDAFEEAVLADGGGGGGGSRPAQADDGAGGGDDDGGKRPTQADDSAGGGGDDGDGPPKIRRPPPPRKKTGDDDDDKGDGKIAQKGVFFFSLGGGIGVGLIKGSGELDPAAHKLDAPGFALAQLGQLAPEVGFFLAPDLLLSAQLRIQYVTGLNGKTPRVAGTCGSDNFCSPGDGALAGFAKLTYLTLDAPFHLTVGGQIGGGNIRHPLEFPDDKMCRASATGATQTCVDSLAGGPFLIGPTAGLWYELGDSIDLTFAVNTALGVPNFTFNFDLDVGLGFRI